MTDKSKHPCFNASAKSKYGRIHLPVAPECNMQCNYCNRKFDCVNESRPGVTSALLNPEQAVAYLGGRPGKSAGNISVAGIAGPGDPFANPVENNGNAAAGQGKISGPAVLHLDKRPRDRPVHSGTCGTGRDPCNDHSKLGRPGDFGRKSTRGCVTTRKYTGASGPGNCCWKNKPKQYANSKPAA